ncbi:endoribonuclease [Wolffia australiana]
MKVVALVSGGKDSCYAMMRCKEYGHDIVALANLMPLEESVDELDSYMFQTVGHQILVSYAECMGVPLFRRRIKGSSRHQLLNYQATSGDEVEDMFILLNEVKKRIPSVTAVCSGAIASDYQRLRVESVCSRLGLISLAYLWKQDQTFLLEEMIRNEIKAIIVKVAAIGLKPSEHLGKEISAMKSHLMKLKELYGINVCGEGGEYETLTLDCPLFKNAQIILDDFKVLLHSEDSIASVGILHPLAFHLEYKDRCLFLSGERTSRVYELNEDYLSNIVACPLVNSVYDSFHDNYNNICTSRTKGSTFSISARVINTPQTPNGVGKDLSCVLGKVEQELNKNGFDWAQVLYIHLYISDMNQFTLANEEYLKFITEKKCHMGVPSRSTIQLPLDEVGRGNAHVEVLVSGNKRKNVLHVQSISCWAPSCIGPYSQATLDGEILYMAGQLGLDPPTMTLCPGGPCVEIIKALENCDAVANCFNGSISSSAILLVIYCSSRLSVQDKSEVQWKVEAFLKQGGFSSNPVFLYVLAPDLPKRALVEVKPVLHIPQDMEASEQVEEQDSSFIAIPQSWDFQHSVVHESYSQKWVLPGKICAATVSVTRNLIPQLCSGLEEAPSNSHFSIPMKQVERISQFCFCLAISILQDNRFVWEDLTSLRFYFSTSLCTEANELELILAQALSELTQGSDRNSGSLDDTIFSVIPVLSSGRSASMDDLLTCELFASKV